MNMPITRIVRAIAHEMGKRRDIGQLEQLNDRMLADIGISRSEIQSAARGRLWRRFQ